MRTREEIQADLVMATKMLVQANAEVERLSQEMVDLELSQRQSVPLNKAERSLMERIAREGKVHSSAETDTMSSEEIDVGFSLRERLFLDYYVKSWTEGYWTITDLGRKKLEEK
jgi:hypothetical protein